MTRLNFAIWRPGPLAKRGYGGVTQRPLDQIEGEVKHSTEGSRTAAFGELDRLTRQASWHFTVDFAGTVYQHYELEDICWHTGLPGDRSVDTSLVGNLTLIGIEHVDRRPDGVQYAQLQPLQVEATIRITHEIRRLCPRIAANPPTLRRNLWEHNWLSATACPSGLIPWPKIIARLEDDMTLTQRQTDTLEAMARLSIEPYTVTWPNGAVTTFPSKLDFLMAHATAFDQHRIVWIAGKA